MKIYFLCRKYANNKCNSIILIVDDNKINSIIRQFRTNAIVQMNSSSPRTE